MNYKPAKNHLRELGQSTIEILIALTIIVLSLAGAIAVIFGGQSLDLDSQESNQALRLAEQNLELAKATSTYNFNGLSSSSSTLNEFLREVIVTAIGTTTKQIISRVSWQTDPLRTQKIELTTLVTNWIGIQATGGDTGGGDTTGDWTNPKTLGSLDLGPGNSATDLDVKNKIIYMTAEASAAAKPDFFIVDATDGQNPIIKSSLNTGPSLNSVDAASNYAYVANNDPDAQLQIINVSNILSPILIKSFKLPNVSGAGAVGNTIFYYSSKVYIGTKRATGPEFHIVDVTDPANPIALGSKEINADVNDIHVNNNLAYLATSDSEELKILDVGSPMSITQIGGFNAPGDSENGKSLWLVLNKLYLGRTLGGNHDNHHELHILDVSSSTQPQNLGSKNFVSDINGIRVKNNLAFLATSDSNSEFQTWNIADPQNITFWSSFNFPQIATGIDYEDNLVYVSVRSNDALRIITSQ